MDGATVGEERARIYVEAGFPPDGGLSKAFVELARIGPIPIGFPNTDSRRRAVVLHDLHHIVTGYGMDWAGEAEISAWEIATGCGRFAFAWFINLQGMVMGWVVAPRRTWRAWVRGRHSKSLYREGWREALLSERVADMRARLELDRPAPAPTLADAASYTVWCSLAAALAVVLLGLPIAGIAALIRAVL
jgi:hypothetical protein